MFLRASPTLRPLLMLDGVLSMVGVATWSTAVGFLEIVLHVRAANNGWLQASAGVGGVLGTLFAARLRGSEKGSEGWILTGITATYLCLGSVTSLPHLVSVWFVRGLVLGVFTVVLSQQLAREVPSHLMGRVQAAWEQLAILACFLGSASSPLLMKYLGPALAFKAFGYLMLALCAARWGQRFLARARR